MDPVGGAIGLTLLLAFFLLGGLLRIALAITARRQGRSVGIHLTAGMVNLILAALIIVGWPATGTWMIGLFVGVELMLGGHFLILSPAQITGQSLGDLDRIL